MTWVNHVAVIAFILIMAVVATGVVLVSRMYTTTETIHVCEPNGQCSLQVCCRLGYDAKPGIGDIKRCRKNIWEHVADQCGKHFEELAGLSIQEDNNQICQVFVCDLLAEEHGYVRKPKT